MIELAVKKNKEKSALVFFFDFINFNSDLMKDYLSERNMQADYYQTLDDLLKICDVQRPNVIVCNLELKKEDISWFTSLKQKCSDIPIIILTSAKLIVQARKLLNEGAFVMMRTPVNMEELYIMISRAAEFRTKDEAPSVVAQVQDMGKVSKLLDTLSEKSNVLLETFADVFPDQISVYNDSLLQKMVDIVSDVLQVEIVSLILIDQKTKDLIIVAQKGLPPDILNHPPRKMGEGIAGFVAEAGIPILTDDVERFKHLKVRDYDDQYKTGSFISLPLKVGTRIIGVMNVNNKKDGTAFNQDDLRILEIINCQILLSLRNAQLLHDQNYELHIDQALNQMDQFIVIEKHSDRMIKLMLDKFRDVLETDVLMLFMYDETTQSHFLRGFSSRRIASLNPSLSLRKGEGIEGIITEVKKPVLISNAENDDRVSPKIRSIVPVGIKSIAAYPIQDGEKLIGIIEAINKVNQESFSTKELYLLKRFSLKILLALFKIRSEGNKRGI